MGKHIPAGGTGPIGNAGLGVAGRLALVAAAVVTVAGAGVLIGPAAALDRLPWAGDPSCATVNVDLVVSPELQSVVSQIVEPVRGAALAGIAPDGDAALCAGVQVRGQEPLETATASQILPIGRAPQIWIPDGASWAAEARWPSTPAGSLATSPVVIGTSRAAAADLGWDDQNPTWRNVLRGNRPVAVPDYRAQSESLDMLLALWTTLGRNARAEKQVVATVLASDRQEVPSPADAIATARSGASQAPLIPVTEQQIAHLNSVSQRPNLVGVYPREGSPRLDYPILSIQGTATTAPQQQATADVISALRSSRAQDLLRQAGFRNHRGDAPVGTGIRADYGLELTRPSSEQVKGMIARIDNLAKPSRILAVIDVSRSMSEKLDDGITRIDLAAAAARLGANLLPDSGYVGSWIFATKMNGSQDYRELAPIERLGSQSGTGDSHRSHLLQLATRVNRYLEDGGTALYDVTGAAFAKMHQDYDPQASNAIILMSDGSNDDPNSVSLNALLAKIRAGNRGSAKVAIFTAALGPDADSVAMRRIAEASGGHSYIINDAQDGQRALLDGLRRAHNIGQS